MGGTTRESIRAYRYDAGLPISGAIDGPLLESLRPAQSEEAGAILGPQIGETVDETSRQSAPDQEPLSATPLPAE
jgi:hypothetical protein